VLNAESRFQGQTIPDPPQGGTADDPETVDAEVVDDAPPPPEPAKARKVGKAEPSEPPAADDDATLFRGLDAQYEQDRGGSES
jgi:hypothetical protein